MEKLYSKPEQTGFTFDGGNKIQEHNNSDMKKIIINMRQLNDDLRDIWVCLYETLARYDESDINSDYNPFNITVSGDEVMVETKYQIKEDVFDNVESLKDKINILKNLVTHLQLII